MSVAASSLPGNKGNAAAVPITTTPSSNSGGSVDASTLPGNKNNPQILFNAPTATNGNQVPTKAPAVFSATTATNKVNNVYIPTMNAATSAVANHNATTAASFDPTYNFQPGETAVAYNARIKAYKANQMGQTTTPQQTQPAPSASDKAATDIANTPDVGHQFVWDANGNKVPIPIGTTPPAGYSTTQPPANPVTSGTPMVDHFVDTQGNTFAQYNNGTYGQIDSNGNFVGTISPQDFDAAKANSPQAQLDILHTAVAQIQTSLSMVANGSYPLNPSQQAIINGLQTQLAADVATQTQANADLTGGTTVAMNLYGMGTSLAGIGKIKATVDSGVQKILDLQTKAATATAQMSESFMKDDMEMLKTAYDMYDSSAKEIQANIDKITDGIRQAKIDARNEAHQEFQDVMASNNYTLAQKKEVFDEYMSQAQLDETKKKDAQDVYFKAQDLALRQQAQNQNDPTGSLAALMAARGSDGYTDPNKYAALRAASKMSAPEFDNRFGFLVNPESTAKLGIGSTATAGNSFATPTTADKSAVFSAIGANPAAAAQIDMNKLQSDPTYFYWVKSQLGA